MGESRHNVGSAGISGSAKGAKHVVASVIGSAGTRGTVQARVRRLQELLLEVAQRWIDEGAAASSKGDPLDEYKFSAAIIMAQTACEVCTGRVISAFLDKKGLGYLKDEEKD